MLNLLCVADYWYYAPVFCFIARLSLQFSVVRARQYACRIRFFSSEIFFPAALSDQISLPCNTGVTINTIFAHFRQITLRGFSKTSVLETVVTNEITQDKEIANVLPTSISIKGFLFHRI
jgi:hypothetical protein